MVVLPFDAYEEYDADICVLESFDDGGVYFTCGVGPGKVGRQSYNVEKWKYHVA